MQVIGLAFDLCRSYDLHMKPLAVFTGDLIGSSDASPDRVDGTMATLDQTARDLAPLLGVESLHFTRFRGDGWQVLVGEPKNLYFAATLFLAQLRASSFGIETRIGIGVAPINSRGTRDLSDARGEAFVMSGHALDEMDTRDTVSLQTCDFDSEHWQVALLDTLAFLSGRWSEEQAVAIAMKLENLGEPLIALAQQIGITRQAFSDRLSGAGWRPIQSALGAFGTFAP
jgi:hypothetical protein